jgi:hypothetical protein
VLEEIYYNVVPHWSAILISRNHSITRLDPFIKSASNQRSLLSEYGPCESLNTLSNVWTDCRVVGRKLVGLNASCNFSK